MKKKVLAIILGTCMALSLVACTQTASDKEADTESEESADNTENKIEEPEIVPVYLDLEVTSPEKHEVTDEDVDYEVNFTLEEAVEYVEVTDRAVEEGDQVNLDYTGYVDGEAFDGGADTGFDLVIGSGRFIPGFEEGLIGANAGDELDVTVTFPDPYTNNEAMSGKEAVFKCKINSISEGVAPELTDEFVQTISETATTVDEFKADIRKQLEEHYANMYESEVQEVIWDAVFTSVTVETYPETIVAGLEDQLHESYVNQAEYYQTTVEELIAMYGMTEETFNEYIHETACKIYVSNRIVEYIAEEQDLVPSDEEYQDAITKIAESYGYTSAEEILEYAKEDDLKMDVLTDIVIEWLVDNSTLIAAE